MGVASKVHPSHATKVLMALREAKVPLVFHNGLLDILHIYDKFIGNIPGEYPDFGKAWLDQFPLLFDTRLIGQEGRLKFRLSGGLSLEELHRHFLAASPVLRVERTKEMGSDRSAHGSAGHDARL